MKCYILSNEYNVLINQVCVYKIVYRMIYQTCSPAFFSINNEFIFTLNYSVNGYFENFDVPNSYFKRVVS